MNESERPFQSQIKEEPKSKQSLNIPTSYSFRFPALSYFQSLSSLEQSQKTDDSISQADDSEFKISHIKTSKHKQKPNKTPKHNNSSKSPAPKSKKEQAKLKKPENSLLKQNPSFQQLVQNLPIGINDSGSISETSYLKPKNKRKKKSKTVKVQVKDEKIEAKHEEQSQLYVKQQPDTGIFKKQQIDYLSSICQFHIVDFKYHHRNEDFRVERDVFYVLVPKRIKKESKESKEEDIPRQLVLTGEQVCENRDLFQELVRFYRGLSRDVGLTDN